MIGFDGFEDMVDVDAGDDGSFGGVVVLEDERSGGDLIALNAAACL